MISKIRRFYKSITELHWEIAFLNNSLEEIINGNLLSCSIVTHNYKNSWFADPFILSVTDDTIEVFVEEVEAPNTKGHISKLTIDRKHNHVVSKKIVLERPGHLSFPVIYRKDNKVYVCPENSQDGVLNLYEYDSENEKFIFVQEMCNLPLTDAICTDLFGRMDLFSTDTKSPNGYQLDHYVYNSDENKFVYSSNFIFSEKIARMAGNFFKVGDIIYRPAQESNTNYGHSLSIQRVIYQNGNWNFKEVTRLFSPISSMSVGFHTLNSYKGVVVVDVKGYRNKLLGPLCDRIVALIKKII